MLFTTNGQAIDCIPYPDTYNLIRARLSDEELKTVKNILNHRIDGKEIPGDDPHRVIYEKAARGNDELAKRMFGLIYWIVFQERADTWSFVGRYEKDNIQFDNLTYFKVQDFPALME